MQTPSLLILGSGAAGCTAAIYAARAGLKPTLIRGNQPGGQLTITTDVENYPGFAQTIQGPWLMEQMEAQARHCGAEIVEDHIVKAELSPENPITRKSDNPIKLTGQSGQTYTAPSLIIATGATAKWLGLPGEKTFNGKGVSACATCDGAFYRGRDVCVVGGGNTAMEEALYLAGIAKSVTLIHRRDTFRGEKVLQERVKNHDKITTLWNHKVDEILGDPHPITGGVTGLKLSNTQTGQTQELKTHGLFVAIGHQPNTQLFTGQLDMDETGYLKTAPGTVFALHNGKSLPGIFAAGDVADPIYRQAVTAAGMGCMAALDANRYLESL
ncbi:MAG: thioredoxin-disulfide reductase [Proteobacteria bacterium]|nr:thioredoxin-disulfide reductase [Pseudomonadota bacterium]